ncbi:MAG: hypothetical protein OXD47_00605 [Gammaproteobacteria bacterium]|nr:hypothetical protein [Gammaproteobacteria bacterium]MCY4283058.1 hypothetical protein [Gammaproteobacteria bacterium]MCY4337283.1 hypothetical protein [Gammaproteobacteria bacterium]
MARNRRPIRCGKVRAKFIARKKIEEIPVQSFNTVRGELRVSTPEATAFDITGKKNILFILYIHVSSTANITRCLGHNPGWGQASVRPGAVPALFLRRSRRPDRG